MSDNETIIDEHVAAKSVTVVATVVGADPVDCDEETTLTPVAISVTHSWPHRPCAWPHRPDAGQPWWIDVRLIGHAHKSDGTPGKKRVTRQVGYHEATRHPWIVEFVDRNRPEEGSA